MSLEVGGACCQLVLCDGNIPFIRKFSRECDPGGAVETVVRDFELDGETPYVTINDVTFCGNDIVYQYEGLHLTPLCDLTTKALVGYYAVIRTETEVPATTTLYFDLTITPIGSAPANSGPCPDVEVIAWEECFVDDVGEFTRVFIKDITTDIVTVQDHDPVTGADYVVEGAIVECTPEFAISEEEVCVTVGSDIYTAIKRTTFSPDPVDEFIGTDGAVIVPDSWVPGLCDFETVTAYIFNCLRFDNIMPVNADATFNDVPTGTNEITFEDITVASLVRNEIVKAQRIQDQELLHGMPVSPVVITTDTGETYTFNPNGLQTGTGVTLVVNEASIITWGANITDTVLALTYSVFDSCDCQAVEVLQWIKDSNEVFLVDVFDITYDQVTGQKISLIDENLLLDFYTLGPFAGPCPEIPQVMEVKKLCCNNDLATGSPDLAAKRLAWLDASDSSLMYEGGNPIAGIDGEDVDEVRDKLAPGVSPSFVVPANVGPGDDAPPTAPTFIENGLNDLSVLNFDKADFDRLRLDTGNPPNSSFSLFYLVSASDPILDDHACIIAVGLNESDGGGYAGVDGAWQLSRDGTDPSFIFRLSGPVSGVPGTDPIMIVQTGPYSPELSPSDGPGALTIERAIAREDEFFNGQFHLITVSFEDTTQILSAYFDGELRLQMDLTPTGFQMGSDYFRIFGNRAGTAYLSGQLAEMYYADSFLTPDETAEFNSYLICKWGIDPSLVAGGQGDLELAPQGTYSAPSPFVEIHMSDGTIVYNNLLNGQEFVLPPVPGLSVCASDDPCVTLCPAVDFAKSIVVDLGTGETWTPASLPASNVVTGLTVSVITGVADNGVTDADATLVSNIPTGFTLTWNVNEDSNTLLPPQIIDAGAGGRMIINMTLRDDS